MVQSVCPYSHIVRREMANSRSFRTRWLPVAWMLDRALLLTRRRARSTPPALLAFFEPSPGALGLSRPLPRAPRADPRHSCSRGARAMLAATTTMATPVGGVVGRGLHSSTSQLNVSRFWHCLALSDCLGRFPNHQTTQRIPQKVLTSSPAVVECKPLVVVGTNRFASLRSREGRGGAGAVRAGAGVGVCSRRGDRPLVVRTRAPPALRGDSVGVGVKRAAGGAGGGGGVGGGGGGGGGRGRRAGGVKVAAAGGSLGTTTRTHDGRARTTFLQSGCSYRRT